MSFPPRFDSASASRWLPVACGTYVLVGGLVSLAGWAFDVPSLADWDRNGITIQPNAAVAAALTGLALTLLGAGRRRWTAGLGLAVLAIAGLTITEHLTGIDFGIDRRLLFGRTWGSAGTLSPGRMGPPGSVGWLLAGCALLAAAARGRRRRVVPLLGLVVLTLSGLSLVGYVVGAGGLYTVPGMTVIALQSSTFLFVSGLGLLTSGRAWDPMRTMFEDSAAGLLARRALPLAFVLPVTIAFLLRLGTAAGHYDAAMATALLVVIVIVMICAVLWWGVIAVRNRERALTEAHAQLTEAHASLGRSEARMNAFLKQLPMGVGMFDSAGRWIYGNPMLNRFVRLDRPASDPQQLARWRFFDQAGVPIARTDWPAARVLRGETVAGMEVLHTLEDGRQIWTRIIGAPFRDDDGRIRGAVAILQDIDEQKRAEEALASAERQLRLVTDHVPVLIAQCDTAGRYKFVNRAYAERLGVTPEQMVGRHFGEVLGPQAHAVVGQHVDQALAGRVVEFEIDVADPTGPRVMHVAYTPERDAQGTVVGLIAAIHDITERKRAEDAVREANVRKDHFLAMLAHELRNPLAPLVSSLAVLQRGAADPATVDRLLQTMERQVGLMVRLIDDLMDIGRLAFNKLSLQRSPTSLSSVVHDAIDACHPAIHAAGQRLEVTVPPSPVYVNVDAARLTQSLGNLLNNASKYSPPGGRIDLEVVVSGSDVIIRVSDVGIGIAPEVLPSMFEMFTQADASLERARGGLGLGLGLARQLVEMHGGTLTASSPGLGLGSSFVITLRGVVCRSAPPLPDAVPVRPLDVNRVLVVDDNDDAAVSLQLMLELHGLQVDVVHDGRQALAVAALHRPDAVLLDIGLPGLNGYDVCREMRRQPWSAGTRILAMTGWGLPEDRRRSLEAGFDDHLVKPVDYEALIKALRPGTDRPNSMSPRSQIDRLLH